MRAALVLAPPIRAAVAAVSRTQKQMGHLPLLQRLPVQAPTGKRPHLCTPTVQAQVGQVRALGAVEDSLGQEDARSYLLC